jgi:hypothetical protein
MAWCLVKHKDNFKFALHSLLSYSEQVIQPNPWELKMDITYWCRHICRVWGNENPYDAIQHVCYLPKINVAFTLMYLLFWEPTVPRDTFLDVMQSSAFHHILLGTVFQLDVAPSNFVFVPLWTGRFLIVGWEGGGEVHSLTSSFFWYDSSVRRCIQKFPDWLPGARTANGTALWH